MAESVPSPRRDDTSQPDELTKVHRTEAKTKTVAEAKRQGPTLDTVKANEKVKKGAVDGKVTLYTSDKEKAVIEIPLKGEAL